MAVDTVWDTAQGLLTSLNAYQSVRPEVSIGYADGRVPEPTLTWVASEEGAIRQTWSIPLRLFESTLSMVRDRSSQESRKELWNRIQALKNNPIRVLDLRARSGSVRSSDPLVSFLYTLMRDHMTPGEVEAILQEDVEKCAGKEVEYSNGWLANYAKDLAKRLTV